MKTIAILLVLTMVSIVSHAQDVEVDPSGGRGLTSGDSLDVYEFPIIPGAPEWRGIPGMRGSLDICQIPGELLREMSTRGLVHTCLAYPRRHYWQVSSQNVLTAIRGTIEGFNGLRELMRRPDAGSALLDAYRKMDPSAFGPHPWTEDERTRAKDLSYVEMLLSQEEVLSGLGTEEKYDLLEVSQGYFSARNEHTWTVFGTVNTLMGRTLLSLGYEPFVEEHLGSEVLGPFLEVGLSLAPHEEIVDRIRRHAEQCLAERRKGESR